MTPFPIFSSIATAISAVAILASLVFVNIQVRQAEKYQRASIQQERASRTADIAMSLSRPGLCGSAFAVHAAERRI